MVEATTKKGPEGMRNNKGFEERREGSRLRPRNEANTQTGLKSEAYRKVSHEQISRFYSLQKCTIFIEIAAVSIGSPGLIGVLEQM